ncbi:MAG: hypothetical protein V4582_21100 [Pseudomonadota bacterium]
MKKSIVPVIAAALLAAAACSPKYNWRDYRGTAAPYTVMFPDKPASQARAINLNGLNVSMTMAAARVDEVMFAVGSAETPDEAQAQAALQAMKTAMVKNIGATITKEKSNSAARVGPGGALQTASIDIEATGMQNGEAMLLVGHFEERGKRIYQVIVMGRQKAITRDSIDMFLSSFKLD